MKAIGLYRYLPIEDPESLIDLRQAHAKVETGEMIGKIVLEQFPD